MKLGIVGKPNVGKSTFFQCITDSEAEIGDYPFTTIEPNKGVGYVVVDCACNRMEGTCNPTTRCENGKRFVPVNVLDVAGLVPGAAEGKGMGNAFLDSVREADALLHIIDVSGATDAKGEPTEGYDPREDVAFVEDEFDAWMTALVQDRWDTMVKEMRSADATPEEVVAAALSGLGITRTHVSKVLSADVGELQQWSEEDVEAFVEELRVAAKPFVYACNKMDTPDADENLERLRDAFPDDTFVPMSAQAEHTLQRAAEQGAVAYTPGDASFDIIGEVSEAQKEGLERIRAVMEAHGGTGVQQAMNTAVFDALDMIAVYPVEDAANWTDKEGNVLPDVVLLPAGSTPVDLAYAIHSDIGDRYAKAVDAGTGRALGKAAELEDGQVVKIQTQ